MKIMKGFFIHTGFVLILIGLSIICVDQVSANINNYYADLEKCKQIVKSVDINYTKFKDGANKVKDAIGDVSLSFDFYLDDFESANSVIKKKIIIVEQEIENLNMTADSLINSCKYNLNDSFMDSECNSFKINYGNMISSYNEMIEQYNKVIKYYNDYALENGKHSEQLYISNLGDEVKLIIDNIK